MRINDVTDRFARLENRSGCSMRSKYDSDTKSQQLLFRGTVIAEIYDYKNPQNFRLRILPRGRYMGKTEFINRIGAVFVSVQTKDAKENKWEHMRYSAHYRYDVKVYDRKLSAEYTLRTDHPMEFAFVDGQLTLDYAHLESRAFPEKPVVAVPIPNENSNLSTVTMQLNAIMAGV